MAARVAWGKTLRLGGARCLPRAVGLLWHTPPIEDVIEDVMPCPDQIIKLEISDVTPGEKMT